MITGVITSGAVGAALALATCGAVYAAWRRAPRLFYRPTHRAGRPAPPAPELPHLAPGVWLPATLPEQPTLAELALDAAFSNRLARYTPRPVRPAVVAWCQVTAAQVAIAGPLTAAHVAAAWADDREAFTRWGYLAPAWSESTDMFPAVTGLVRGALAWIS